MLDLLLLPLAVVGHAALWVTVYNQTHSRAMPKWVIRAITVVNHALNFGLPPLLAWWYLDAGRPIVADLREGPSVPALYIALCGAIGMGTLFNLAAHLRRPPTEMQRSCRATHCDLLAELGSRYDGTALSRWAARMPFNELLELTVDEKELEIPRLPPALDGLAIVHVSDFHFTGSVGKSWFEEVVRRANALEGDLVAVTGDLVDEREVMGWVPDTLGRLTAPHGVYFVLGNHDLKIDYRALRRMAVAAGMVDLGGRALRVTLRGQPVVLGGNELPWFPPAANFPPDQHPSADGGPLRILLAHSPDQFAWARRQQVDLMLAGHTHGGQLRLPWIGPLVSSSRTGIRYVAGTYYEPPTVMHVSRGVSGTIPLRLNCPPEVTRLVLRRAREMPSSGPSYPSRSA